VIGGTTALTRAASALLLVVSFALCGLLGGVALAAEGTQHESEAEFAKQLAAKEVKAVTINKRLRSMRVTLADGRHVLARYPKKQEPQTASRLRARGVAVTVLSKHDAEKEAGPKKAHHKIRYIVGGAVILVIVIAGAVLLVSRRRRRD
jgi:ABC-type nickel/cobalt efflux system permease component RcnA